MYFRNNINETIDTDVRAWCAKTRMWIDVIIHNDTVYTPVGVFTNIQMPICKYTQMNDTYNTPIYEHDILQERYSRSDVIRYTVGTKSDGYKLEHITSKLDGKYDKMKLSELCECGVCDDLIIMGSTLEAK